MNRRSFLETLAKAAAAFTILPPATTYARVWRAQRNLNYHCIMMPDVNHYGDIDYLCDRVTADKLQAEFVRYYHDKYVKALEKAWDDQYAQFNANGGWGRFKDLPLADKS
jgi:hypothetical protein